jgi:hypothetical protein
MRNNQKNKGWEEGQMNKETGLQIEQQQTLVQKQHKGLWWQNSLY